jgi:hypothetical protein
VTAHDVAKALEVWTLQNLVNGSILIGILALGITMLNRYFSAIEQFLTLRVSIEIWRMLTVLLVDVLLIVAVIIGFLALNPDIMADIKMALPFLPIATVLFAIALFLRLFHGGHTVTNPNFFKALWLMFAANVCNIIGFVFIMEAPSSEYLAEHPSGFWTFLKTGLRSNANLEMTQVTFYIFFPILMIVFLWGFKSGLDHIKNAKVK